MRNGLRALRDTLPNELELTSKVFQNPLASVSPSKMRSYIFVFLERLDRCRGQRYGFRYVS